MSLVNNVFYNFNNILNYKAEFTVLIILAAILYGSPFEAGLLSSQPFHPFERSSGMRIEHPLSETP
jgi:hypothetical protein